MMLASAGLNPLSLSPALWLDASDASTLYDATTGGSLTAADGVIARFEDKSGNARHMTQGTGISQPLRKTAVQNGRDVIRFDGSNDFMSIASSTAMFNFLHNGTASDVFAVVKMGNGSDPNAVYTVIANNGATSSQTGIWTAFDDRASASANNAILGAINKSSLGNQVASGTSNNVWTPNQFTLAHWRFDADHATAADRLIMRINGGTELKPSTATNAPVTSNASSNLILGAINASATLPSLMDFAEILIFPAPVSDSERLSVQQYLKSKWALY